MSLGPWSDPVTVGGERGAPAFAPLVAPAPLARLHAWSSAQYSIALPAGHRFPIEKYALVRERVLAEGLIAPDRMHVPPRIARVDLLRVHAADYVDRLASGTLAPLAQRRIGFPWSDALVERSLRAVGGTCAAANAALDDGVAINLAGGTHHAFASYGEGFCVFNDVAVAIRALQHRGRIRRALVIDLDVHQGNGTNAIFAGDADVFTFSLHGERNYPFHKVPGSLDIALGDRTGDEAYLNRLADVLPRVLATAAPDLVVYLAGADPHERDTLGRLALTFDGLARRDAMVIESCRAVGLPVAIVIAGGYGASVAETVQVHVTTVRVAAIVAGSPAR